jgi:hypothetical protein
VHSIFNTQFSCPWNMLSHKCCKVADDDLHWVRALTILMHVGLIDKPLVPHNLISAQESPSPLPKFQTIRRLKIVMSSGSKKGTIFFQKVPASESPPGSPTGPLWREMPADRTFILISLSQIP